MADVGHVLVLNATYQRLNFISQQRAVVLLLKEKAEPIEVDPAVKAALRAHVV